MAWHIRFYNQKLQDELHDLPAGLLARFVRYAEQMSQHGPDLGMPHTRAMGKGLFELRLKAAEGIARVFYCTVVDRQIVFLHQFVKKQQRTPPKELQTALKRMKEFI